MILLLTTFAALAAEPCPTLATGDAILAGVIVDGHLSCDGVLTSTSNINARHADLLTAQAATEKADAALATAQAEAEAAATERDGEHIALVACQAALTEATRGKRVPGWVPYALGVGTGVGACWLSPGAH